jgi:hypothetical protein
MKRLALAVALVLAVAAVLSGCIRIDRYADEGSRTTREYDLTGFKKIEIGHAFQLEVAPSDNYSITVTAGDKFLEKLDVHLRGETLVFSLSSWMFTFHESPRAVVTMPELTGLDLSGATSGTAAGFATDEAFELKLSGASNLTMDLVTGPFRAEISGASRVSGGLTAVSTDLELSGASGFNVDGTGGDITLHVSGASRAELRDYAVNDVDADLSGASTAYLDTGGHLDASISGASRVTYTGQPAIGDLDITGGSSFRHEE